LLNVNRTVVSGARLDPTGPAPSSSAWSAWDPPACAKANGAGLVAAASATDIYALCAEGVWGTPDPGTTAPHNWLFHSTDGGQTFSAVGEVPGRSPLSFTVAPGSDQTIVVDDSQVGLEASFDGGRTWKTVEPGTAYSSSGGEQWFGYVGFTTASQGVAVRYKPAPEVLITRDGGRTWSAVKFTAG
jgi:photosystem II stability/assembly factor-like uncharacterized protein